MDVDRRPVVGQLIADQDTTQFQILDVGRSSSRVVNQRFSARCGLGIEQATLVPNPRRGYGGLHQSCSVGLRGSRTADSSVHHHSQVGASRFAVVGSLQHPIVES